MDTNLHKELLGNLKQAVKIAKGKVTPKTIYTVFTPAEIKAIRLKRAKMSQKDFARAFALSIDTLKGWEQGKRSPDAAANNYLRMIKANPKLVQTTIAP